MLCSNDPMNPKTTLGKACSHHQKSWKPTMKQYTSGKFFPKHISFMCIASRLASRISGGGCKPFSVLSLGRTYLFRVIQSSVAFCSMSPPCSVQLPIYSAPLPIVLPLPTGNVASELYALKLLVYNLPLLHQ